MERFRALKQNERPTFRNIGRSLFYETKKLNATKIKNPSVFHNRDGITHIIVLTYESTANIKKPAEFHNTAGSVT